MRPDLEIVNVAAYEVCIPIEAPIRHSYGVHEAFTRTIVEVTTAGGLVGLGETAASADEVIQAAGDLIELSALDLSLARMRVSQRFYWSESPLVASAFEIALIDVVGKALDVPAYAVLGGKFRDEVDLAAYCFFRYEGDNREAVDSPEAMANHAAELADLYGFQTIKLKAGVLEPATEVAALAAIRDRLPDAKLRIDPNGAWTLGTALALLAELERIGLEYLEDPVAGQPAMARLAEHTHLPLSTNMCAVKFRDLPSAIDSGAVDIILSDPWYWGGPTRVAQLATLCETFGIGLGMHSGIELGIGMAVMAHTAVTLPNLTMAVDAHYHHLTGDVITGDRLLPKEGRISPPSGPGWGVTLDDAAVEHYRGVFESGRYRNVYVGGNSRGPDPWRPGWYPTMPAW